MVSDLGSCLLVRLANRSISGKPKARFILLNVEFDSSYSVSGCSLRDFQSASELSLDLMYDTNIQILRVSHQMPNISSYFV